MSTRVTSTGGPTRVIRTGGPTRVTVESLDDAQLFNIDSSHAATDGPQINAGIFDWASGSSVLVPGQAARAVRSSTPGAAGQARTTRPLTGLVYAEFEVLSLSGSPGAAGVGVVVESHSFGTLNYFWVEDPVNNAAYLLGGGYAGRASGSHIAPAIGEFVQMAFNADSGELWFGVNDNYDGVPGVSGPAVVMPENTYRYANAEGQTTFQYRANFGQRPWEYTPPTGFVGIGDYPT